MTGTRSETSLAGSLNEMQLWKRLAPILSNAAARGWRGRNVMDGSQALSYKQYVMHCGNDREGEGRAQKRQPRDGNPSRFIYFHEQHKEDGGDLRKCVRFAEDAGAEVAQPGDSIKQRANYQDGNVAAENQYGKFPGNFVQDGEHQKHRAQQQLVGDGIEILSQDGLLFEGASQQAIESIAHPS